MSKVFGKNNGRPNRVKRNTIDLSFQNNLTTNFGRLTPVLCKEVLPGDSFDMDLVSAFRFMPMVFPVQTRMRVDFHAFYVRNRNLWEDWEDFICGTKQGLNPPVMSPTNAAKFTTGSLADYLGIPTTYASGVTSSAPLVAVSPSPYMVSASSSYPSSFPWEWNTRSSYPVSIAANVNGVPRSVRFVLFRADVPSVTSLSGSFLNTLRVPSSSGQALGYYSLLLIGSKDGKRYVLSSIDDSPVPLYSASGLSDLSSSLSGSVSVPSGYSKLEVAVTFTYIGTGSTFSFPSPLTFNADGDSVSYTTGFDSTIIDMATTEGVKNPFTVPGCMVSALPFRAYESIYNSFYRDDRNNPYVVGGQPEYNKYLSDYSGGIDNNVYPLRYRNWDQDLFTTALPTPQQGGAPLVGISSTGAVTIEDSETGKQYVVQATTGDDADTITGFTTKENLPTSVARAMVNYATSGISINDFRNVNAYQRWLETNIRRGLKYRDQIKSHYDVDVSFKELDMPEFIGGCSVPINVGTVNQTSESSTLDGKWGSPLGSYAGQAFAVGSCKNRIRHYFDEHGFLMVIMSVVPQPNYSQAMDKFWFKYDKLDYFFPEFGHIGLQAIPQAMLSPIQTAQSGNNPKSLFKTFGYNRPWYEYLESRDEIHGLVRSQLNNFVLNRVFNSEPSLSTDFVTINPEQLNDIFSVTDISDKIIGQVYFDIKAKRPIPLYGVPRLESNL